MRILTTLLFILIASCSSKKDILLIQDSNPAANYNTKFEEIKIQPDDILKIKISSKAVDIASLYNSQKSLVQGQSIFGYQVEGYLVDSNGFVNIPTLDPVLVSGLTINQASSKIKSILKEEDLLKNATVDIKILNAYFTVIGEVNVPGRYSFLENNMNILQAIGIAGDLTINGKRDDIKVISKRNGKMIVNSIDLTSSLLLESKSFQVFPGDIIIVNANTARVKNAGIVGNFGNLLSVMSFILTSIILITQN